MDLKNFFTPQNGDLLFNQLFEEKKLVLSGVANHSSKSYLASYFFDRLPGRNLFWIVDSTEQLIDIEKSLKLWTDHKVYPIYGDISDIYKINLIINIAQGKNNIFILTRDKLTEQFTKIEYLEEHSITIKKGESIDLINFFSSLQDNNYELSLDASFGQGMYRKSGGIVDIFPINSNNPYKIEIDGDEISQIFEYDMLSKKTSKKVNSIEIFPNKMPEKERKLVEIINKNDLIVNDELEFMDSKQLAAYGCLINNYIIELNSFPGEKVQYHHLRYLSVIRFYSVVDLIADLRQKIKEEWNIVICTKRVDELKAIFSERKLAYSSSENDYINIVKLDEDAFIPHSFQNPDEKFLFLSEKEIFTLQKSKRNQSVAKLSIDFITSLNPNDYVVHFDHGIGLFKGLTNRCIDSIEREYLELAYSGSDKLFVPIDQVDKVSKYMTEDDQEPRLSRLGSTHWKTVQGKVKAETREMANELLELYAKRAQVKRPVFVQDTESQIEMESEFPYELTPGQSKAISEIKQDMEKSTPMDRLLVGDVGFGKTEIAVRAAFKAAESGKQVAVIAPVTILAVQHFETFTKRMSGFGKKIEVLTRFKTPAQQRKVLEDLKRGRIDIIIGTHRLLSSDVEFMNLGLLVIDEEHRFGVKQKEQLKELRTNIDILTMTATPIPRTLNMGLNKIRDITTITTPPPGRLPIVSEVRRYGDYLVREAILKEINRGGQVFFLHNKVETIEGIAEKLRLQIPEATFIVAHGQLNPHVLEERILDFKTKKFDVLVSSTIIENGIDLPSANTMIVNNAERFGLSQLYQLRGRIGRSNLQAYAFFLYHHQGLSIDARKRLRAIIEASELGSGFQIAMKDLEIRGAGDILGCKQSGSMNVVGVSHFLRLLNKTIEELRAGKEVDSGEDVQAASTIDLPINVIIPETYIPDSKEKMSVYQKLSAVTNTKMLEDITEDIKEEYGPLPQTVKSLCRMLKLKMSSTKARISKIFARSIPGNSKEVVFVFGEKCNPQSIIKVLDINKKWQIRGDSIAIDMKELPNAWLGEIERSVEAMIK